MTRPLAAALLLLAGCVGAPAAQAPLDPRLAACDAELRAFVALTRLAKQAPDWRVYQPAIDAMREQIMDCVDDAYPTPIGI
jgi:hypothetical protein